MIDFIRTSILLNYLDNHYQDNRSMSKYFRYLLFSMKEKKAIESYFSFETQIQNKEEPEN